MATVRDDENGAATSPNLSSNTNESSTNESQEIQLSPKSTLGLNRKESFEFAGGTNEDGLTPREYNSREISQDELRSVGLELLALERRYSEAKDAIIHPVSTSKDVTSERIEELAVRSLDHDQDPTPTATLRNRTNSGNNISAHTFSSSTSIAAPEQINMDISERSNVSEKIRPPGSIDRCTKCLFASVSLLLVKWWNLS